MKETEKKNANKLQDAVLSGVSGGQVCSDEARIETISKPGAAQEIEEAVTMPVNGLPVSRPVPDITPVQWNPAGND